MQRLIESGDLADCLAKKPIVLDVRSPGEFAEDHLPGARNIPILDDLQREEVGRLHRLDPFSARQLGARYALRAIDRFLGSSFLAELPKTPSFLIYCARGGQRSGSIATVLNQIGYTVFRLKKGYKTYRSYVRDLLELPLPGVVYVLHGFTGSQKTRLLSDFRHRLNVLDLEHCARHRGSVLGALPGVPQPSQKAFETELAWSIREFRPHRPTLIEGESRSIGRCFIPASLWRQMEEARHLWLEMPRSQRVEHILRDYGELRDPRLLEPVLQKLRRYLSKATMDELFTRVRERRWDQFVDLLLQHHYDPLYHRFLQKAGANVLKAPDFETALRLVAACVGVPCPSP